MDENTFEKLVGASLNLPNLPSNDEYTDEDVELEDEELYTCPHCGELVEKLIDTEGMLNGGIGSACPQCYEDLEIGE